MILSAPVTPVRVRTAELTRLAMDGGMVCDARRAGFDSM